MRKIPLTATLLLTVIFITCRKDVRGPNTPAIRVEEIATGTGQPNIFIPPNNTLLPTDAANNFVFDWEHTDQMPVAPWVTPVPAPWSDQAVRHFDESLRYDMKKSDGWELVYSTFSDSVNHATRFLMLYNKFRGVLRFYFYNPLTVSNEVKAARSVINEMELELASSPVLNFADQHIIDMDVNSRQASLLEPNFLEEQGWYISQFELAYDQHASTHNYKQYSFSTSMMFTRMQEMSFNDEPVMNKHINLQQAGTAFIENYTRSGPVAGNFQCFTKSPDDFERLQGVLPIDVIGKLKNSLNDSVPSQVLNGMISLPLNIASSKLEAPGLLNFTPGLIAFVGGLGYAPPGLDNRDIIGIGPAFNESVGIFYLDKKPVILHQQVSGNLNEQYTLDISSVKYIINPFIQNYADVKNFRQEIVAVDPNEGKTLTEAKIYRGNVLKASAPLDILGVRVSFEVVPKNGSAPVKIIKTFKADVHNS